MNQRASKTPMLGTILKEKDRFSAQEFDWDDSFQESDDSLDRCDGRSDTRYHPLSTWATFFEKLTFLTP